MFRPHNTVYRFRRSISDCTARKCFLGWFGLTLITLCCPLQNKNKIDEKKICSMFANAITGKVTMKIVRKYHDLMNWLE